MSNISKITDFLDIVKNAKKGDYFEVYDN